MDAGSILEQLRKRLEENGAEQAELGETEVSGEQRIILLTSHSSFGAMENTAAGEFYFEGDEDDPLFLFVCRLQVLSDIPEESLPLCSAEITLVNREIPLGGFVYDFIDNTVCYVLRTPVSGIKDEGQLLEEADSCIALSLTVADRYSSTIIRCAGERA